MAGDFITFAGKKKGMAEIGLFYPWEELVIRGFRGILHLQIGIHPLTESWFL